MSGLDRHWKLLIVIVFVVVAVVVVVSVVVFVRVSVFVVVALGRYGALGAIWGRSAMSMSAVSAAEIIAVCPALTFPTQSMCLSMSCEGVSGMVSGRGKGRGVLVVAVDRSSDGVTVIAVVGVEEHVLKSRAFLYETSWLEHFRKVPSKRKRGYLVKFVRRFPRISRYLTCV